jgi:hypothetical protein
LLADLKTLFVDRPFSEGGQYDELEGPYTLPGSLILARLKGETMKKLLTLLIAVAVALSLSAPTFATKEEKKEPATSEGKSHKKHAKKKGATEGKKEGQQGTAPAEGTKK